MYNENAKMKNGLLAKALWQHVKNGICGANIQRIEIFKIIIDDLKKHFALQTEQKKLLIFQKVSDAIPF